MAGPVSEEPKGRPPSSQHVRHLDDTIVGTVDDIQSPGPIRSDPVRLPELIARPSSHAKCAPFSLGRGSKLNDSMVESISDDNACLRWDEAVRSRGDEQQDGRRDDDNLHAGMHQVIAHFLNPRRVFRGRADML